MTSLNSIEDDIRFGLLQEKRFRKLYLRPKYPDLVWNSRDNTYSPFDFQSGDKVFELKARQYYKKRWDADGHMCEINKFNYLTEHPELKG